MIAKLPSILASLLAAFLLSSCETTTDYGYYVGELNDETIVNFFALSDEAVNNLNFEVYKSLHSPNFVSIDRTGPARNYTYRQDYLDMVQDIFDSASSMRMDTRIMDIQYSESGHEAIVKVHEEEKRVLHGQTEHYTSMLDVEVGFEEGWIFINKSTRTSMQVIEGDDRSRGGYIGF